MNEQRLRGLVRAVVAAVGTLAPGMEFLRAHHGGWSLLSVAPVATAYALVTVSPDALLQAWPRERRARAFACFALGTLGMLPIYASFLERAQPSWPDVVVGLSALLVVIVLSSRVVGWLRDSSRQATDR